MKSNILRFILLFSFPSHYLKFYLSLPSLTLHTFDCRPLALSFTPCRQRLEFLFDVIHLMQLLALWRLSQRPQARNEVPAELLRSTALLMKLATVPRLENTPQTSTTTYCLYILSFDDG